MDKDENILYEYFTADHKVGIGPLYLYAVLINSGVNSSELTLKKGRSSTSEAAFLIQSYGYDSRYIVFPMPILFDQGLFCDFDSNVQSVVVFYLPV